MSYTQPKIRFQQLFGQPGTLLVTRPPVAPVKPAVGQPGVASDYLQSHADIFIALLASGEVLAFNGHVDLGTGVRTALAQIVAEELSVAFERVRMVLGHTEATPNQGPTIASATIQITSVPLRNASAQAREFLLHRAADQLGVEPSSLSIFDGTIKSSDGRSCTYWSLLRGEHFQLDYSTDVVLKPSGDYTLVGKSVARVDLPLKATGQLVYVHDMRVPGMWHGRVVRPPYIGRDCGEFIGHSLISVDESSVAHIADDIRVVVVGDFVGVVARREEHAVKAAKALKVRWRQPDNLVPLNDLGSALRTQPYKERVLVEKTDAGSPAREGVVLKRTYIWPYQMHASIGPSCSVADFSDEHVRVWSGSQSPHMLRTELSQLLKMDEGRIEIIRMEASGCYGRNCADDACGDAVLLSRAVGHPVRVQLTREQEHGWEPKGAAQLMDVTGSIDAEGNLLSYDFVTRYPSNDAPTLALTLTGTISSAPRVFEMGDRTAVPPYSYPNMRVACLDMAAIVRAAWLRGVSAMPNSFAHDSFIDELAVEAGRDPVAFRLQYLSDDRASALLRETAVKAQWRAGWQGSRGVVGDDGMLHGRGVSYARYVHSRFPGYGAAWAVWFVDVAVHPTTGRVIVKRVVVGQDVGMMVNPAGVRHQLHGNIIQSLSRALKEHVAFDARGVVDLEWGAYPILGFTEIPPIEVYLAPRQDQPPMGAGESSSVPSAAAVGNALFDATGVRFREVPFTPDCILQGLRSTEMAAA
ncbi:MAG: xanthine dehydrogenase family protein molybdopterin-binding subunit [Burkholderiaceae bacterium]|nr:MAG: xanthine dehydrogenase family protein molybdopterin-binding subunit [Burkholderiaceae bacterium]